LILANIREFKSKNQRTLVIYCNAISYVQF